LSAAVRVRQVRLAAACLALGGALLWVLVAVLWFFKDRARDDSLAFPALICLLAAAVLWARSRRDVSRQATAVACLLLVLMELGNARSASFPQRVAPEHNRYLSKMAQYSDIVRFVKRCPWPVRVDLEEAAIGFDFGDWHGIDVLASVVASLPANFVAMGADGERVQMLMGVNYDLRRSPRRPGQQLVFKGADGVNVYQNWAAFPRVWSVHEAVRVEGPEQMRRCLSDPAFDLARKAVVVGAPAPVLEPAAGADSVRLLRREPHWVRIDAQMQSKGMVVLSDAFYPGWMATLDGQRVAIHEVYGGLRGVVAPAGKHLVEMRYRPLSVILGAILTAVGVLGACGLAAWGRTRRRVLA